MSDLCASGILVCIVGHAGMIKASVSLTGGPHIHGRWAFHWGYGRSNCETKTLAYSMGMVGTANQQKRQKGIEGLHLLSAGEDEIGKRFQVTLAGM